MRTAIGLVAVLAACGTTEGVETSSAEQEVVLEPHAVASNLDVLVDCIDLPDNLSAGWLRDRLTYNRSCFNAWTVSVAITDCPLGNRLVSGSIVVAGDEMARLPASGPLIRARAVAAALVDIAELQSGTTKPYVDVNAGGDGLSLTACMAPVAGGAHADLTLAVDNSVLGAVSFAGGAELKRVDGIGRVDFSLAVAGPSVAGEVMGTGISRDDADLCPDAGDVRFAGSIEDEAAEVLLSYTGNDQVVIRLTDGTLLRPEPPPFCTQ